MGLLGAALGVLDGRPWLGLLGWGLLGLLGFLVFGLYVLHLAVVHFLPPQDLRRRYGAEWALVTGGSSGIGRSLCFRLAEQGLNVVVVALADDLLDKTAADLAAKFPERQFRKVPANLGKPGYLEAIDRATKDLDVQVVFNNAGYMPSGFFVKMTLPSLMANLECNLTSAVQITHHFTTKMVEGGLPGCVCFTSSAAALMPSPLSIQYAATKCFLSSFASSLATEVTSKGIDVLAVHPSPVASNFYSNKEQKAKMDALDFFQGFAISPDKLPDEILRAIGRTVYTDIGPTAYSFRLMMKVVDYNFLATLMSKIAHHLPDYKRNSVED